MNQLTNYNLDPSKFYSSSSSLSNKTQEAAPRAVRWVILLTSPPRARHATGGKKARHSRSIAPRSAGRGRCGVDHVWASHVKWHSTTTHFTNCLGVFIDGVYRFERVQPLVG
jgi:hypothetical protein